MISIDFNVAYRHAAEVAECAEAMKRQCGKLSEIISEVRGAWSGDTSKQYIRKLEEFSDQLQADTTKCHDNAISFKMAINEIKRVEEEAAAALAALPSEG